MRFYQSNYAKAQDIQGGVVSVLHVQKGSRKRVMQDVYVKEEEEREWNEKEEYRTYRKKSNENEKEGP